MKYIFILALALVACKESSTQQLTDKPTDPSPRIGEPSVSKLVIFGDDFVTDDSGFAEALALESGKEKLNFSQHFTGSVTGMLNGLQAPAFAHLFPQVNEGDIAIIMAGHHDARWYANSSGADDPGDQAKNTLKGFIQALRARGAIVYVATVPVPPVPVPKYNSASMVGPSAFNFYSSQIREAVSEAGDSDVHLVDLNAVTPNASDWSADGTALSEQGKTAIATIFAQDIAE